MLESALQPKSVPGLTFLHLAKPRPIVHGNVNPSNILLDHNNVAKLHGFRLDFMYDESDIRSDIRDFGSLVLQLLTGRNWCGSVDEVVDQRVGDWPMEVAMEIARIGTRCLCSFGEDGAYTGIKMVMKDIEEVQKMADDLIVSDAGCLVNKSSCGSRETVFLLLSNITGYNEGSTHCCRWILI
ncbi:hypothetical protein R6Q59_008036 [Mikania micrantha]